MIRLPTDNDAPHERREHEHEEFPSGRSSFGTLRLTVGGV